MVEDLPAQAVAEPLAEAPLDVDPELHVLHAEPVHDDEPELDQWLLDEALESTPAAAEAEAEAEPEAEPEVELQAEPEVLELADIEAPAAIEPEPELVAAPVIEPPRAEPATSAFDDRDPELVEIFLEEGFDIIDSAGASLQRWMDDVNNILEVEALQRDLHTLKGGARMAEIREIGDLAHELEFLYEGLCGGRLRASPGLFTLLQACHDRLAEMLEAVRDKRGVPSGDALIEAIKRFRANPDEQLSMPSSVHLQPAAQVVEDDAGESDDILDIFLEEADDLLEAMERTIGRWEERREDAAQIDELLRLLHTLKGRAPGRAEAPG